MSRLRDLFEAVVAAREDDAPRRLYADALLEGRIDGQCTQLPRCREHRREEHDALPWQNCQ